MQAPLVLSLSVQERLKQSLETGNVCGTPLRATGAVSHLIVGLD